MVASPERQTPLRANLRCMLITCVMAFANAQYGFDAAVVSSFQAMRGFLKVFGYPDPQLAVGYGIDTTSQQLITSFLNVGTMFGVLFTAPFSRWFGRRQGIWMGSLLGFAGCAAQIGASNIAGICVGRTLMGASNGFFITFANAYIAECAPPHLRSICSGIFGVTISIGGVLGTVVPYLTKDIDSKLCYQIGLACLFFFPLFLSIVTFFVPESPRWLLIKGRTADAEKALRTLRHNSLSPELLQEEFVEMVRGIEEEKAIASSTALADAFKGTELRRTLLCIGTVASRASSGIWVFLSYGIYFFQQAGIKDPFAMSLYNIAAGIVGSAVAIYCSYKFLGRRSMMLIATGAATLAMTGAALGGTIAPGTQAAAKNFVGFSIIYGVIYGGFSGAVTWPISAEVVSSRLRMLSLAIATAIDYVFAWLTAFCSPYFINPKALNWGPKYCWLWAGSNLLTFFFFYFLLPEMKGRSLEEIDELFEKRIPARKFAGYECECSRQAHEIVIEKKAGGGEAAHLEAPEKSSALTNWRSAGSGDV